MKNLNYQLVQRRLNKNQFQSRKKMAVKAKKKSKAKEVIVSKMKNLRKGKLLNAIKLRLFMDEQIVKK